MLFLAIKSLRSRFFIAFLCVLSISLSCSLFLLVERVRKGVEEGFTNAISGADLIVGARSGPLQLLLYSIFHMGRPVNNISWSTYQAIKTNPAVDWTIPISLGDSYRGYSVVATDENFVKHYRFYGDKKVLLAQGRWVSEVFDVVLGHQVAKALSHKLGDSVVLSHGVAGAGVTDHEEAPFKVVGILDPTATPLDKSVFITLWGMEAIHVGWETGMPDSEKTAGQSSLGKEDLVVSTLTSFILRTKKSYRAPGVAAFYRHLS